METKMDASNTINNEVYYKGLLNRYVNIPFTLVGRNIDTIITKYLSDIEGKCNEEGYIKPNSIKLINYSSGLLNGANIKFNVNFECYICNPTEGLTINCKVTNVSKAGIRAILNTEDIDSPLMVFIIREHNYSNEMFNNIKEDDIINVKIVGSRFELNDSFVTVIGELE